MRVLAMPYTHTLSHLSRVLAVAERLRELGHEVIFAGESANTTFISSQGFSIISCYEPNPDQLFQNIRAGKLHFVDDDEILRMIEADLAAIGKSAPDLLLTDGRFSAQLSSHVAGIPHAAIVNVSSTEYRAIPYVPIFNWVPQWLIPPESKRHKIAEALNLSFEMKLFDSIMNIFSKLSKKFEMVHPVTATNCLTGKDMTLLADIPEYFPTRNLPQNYHYVGPLTWKTNLPLPHWWPPIKSSDPTVYITMGTTGIPDFFSILGQIFKENAYTAIISTGSHKTDLQPLPGKIYVEKYLDGDIAIQNSDLVICHGGNGTIYQALCNGKPILGIPTIPDQRFNMRRVESLGVGKLVELKEIVNDPEILIRNIELILKDSSFLQNAKQMQNILAKYDAIKRSAEILTESF